MVRRRGAKRMCELHTTDFANSKGMFVVEGHLVRKMMRRGKGHAAALTEDKKGGAFKLDTNRSI